jgi:hypothetical protein
LSILSSVNANSGEVRRRAAFEQARRERGPAAWYEMKPAPIRAVPREELLQLALECEAGWNERKAQQAARRAESEWRRSA